MLSHCGKMFVSFVTTKAPALSGLCEMLEGRRPSHLRLPKAASLGDRFPNAQTQEDTDFFGKPWGFPIFLKTRTFQPGRGASSIPLGHPRRSNQNPLLAVGRDGRGLFVLATAAASPWRHRLDAQTRFQDRDETGARPPLKVWRESHHKIKDMADLDANPH